MHISQARLISKTFAELDENIVDYKNLTDVSIRLSIALGVLLNNNLSPNITDEEIKLVLNEMKDVAYKSFKKSRTDLQIHTRH